MDGFIPCVAFVPSSFPFFSLSLVNFICASGICLNLMKLANKNEISLWKRLVNAIEKDDAEKAHQILDTSADPSVLFSHTQNHVVLDHLAGMFGKELNHINIIQLAILENKHEMALMLIEALCKDGATTTTIKRCLNHRCADGNTALHFAAFQNMPLVISALLKKGANPYVGNDQRLRPLDCSHDEEAIQALSSRQVPTPPADSTAATFPSVLLLKAASQLQLQDRPHTPPDTSSIPQDYFDSPPKSTRPRSKDSSISIPTPPPSPTRTSVNALTDTGKRRIRFTIQAVLIDGCINGDIASVQEALSFGAKINSRHGAYDKSPLMVALLNDQENVARLLLTHQDLNINYQDSNGK